MNSAPDPSTSKSSRSIPKERWWNALTSPAYWNALDAKSTHTTRRGFAQYYKVAAAYMLIGALVVMFAPLDVLDRNSWLQQACSWIKVSVAPGIAKYEAASTFPQITLLYFSLMIALMPCAIVASLLGFEINAFADHAWRAQPSNWWRFGSFVLFPILLSGCFYLLVLSPIDLEMGADGRHGSHLYLISNFRVALVILAGAAFSAFILLPLISILAAITPVSVFLRNRGQS